MLEWSEWKSVREWVWGSQGSLHRGKGPQLSDGGEVEKTAAMRMWSWQRNGSVQSLWEIYDGKIQGNAMHTCANNVVKVTMCDITEIEGFRRKLNFTNEDVKSIRVDGKGEERNLIY